MNFKVSLPDGSSFIIEDALDHLGSAIKFINENSSMVKNLQYDEIIEVREAYDDGEFSSAYSFSIQELNSAKNTYKPQENESSFIPEKKKKLSLRFSVNSTHNATCYYTNETHSVTCHKDAALLFLLDNFSMPDDFTLVVKDVSESYPEKGKQYKIGDLRIDIQLLNLKNSKSHTNNIPPQNNSHKSNNKHEDEYTLKEKFTIVSALIIFGALFIAVIHGTLSYSSSSPSDDYGYSTTESHTSSQSEDYKIFRYMFERQMRMMDSGKDPVESENQVFRAAQAKFGKTRQELKEIYIREDAKNTDWSY